MIEKKHTFKNHYFEQEKEQSFQYTSRATGEKSFWHLSDRNTVSCLCISTEFAVKTISLTRDLFFSSYLCKICFTKQTNLS